MSGEFGPPEQPGRPSIREKQGHYERGEGFRRAVAEARRLLAQGLSEAEVLEAVGFPPTSYRVLAAAKSESAEAEKAA